MNHHSSRLPDYSVELVDREFSSHAFLVHSRTSLAQDLPPKSDDSLSARQKRRRTSPQDHAILEAAYQRNSKPDKNERADVVNRVSLGEKEVQIWFQNRRQNDRRRSRPLLPHELVPHFRNDVPKEVLLHSHTFAETIAPDVHASIVDSRPPSAQSFHSHVSILDLLNPASSPEESANGSYEPNAGDATSQETPPSSVEVEPASAIPPAERKEEITDDAEGAGSGKRRTLEGMPESRARKRSRPSLEVLQPSEKPPIVRLSVTVDGAVKVKTSLEDTPSPPKARGSPLQLTARANKGLQRSKSAVESGQLSSDSSPALSTPPVLGRGFGRSRDVRTWEFYCDGDAREALASRAETERNGSAVGAISLIRSQSQKSKRQVLGPNPIAGNSKLAVSSQMPSKPKLSRAKSSLGRLQGSETALDLKPPNNGRPEYVRSISGDSDKENWPPGTRQSLNALQRTQLVAIRHDTLKNPAFMPGNRSVNSARLTDLSHHRYSSAFDQENLATSQSMSRRKDRGKGEEDLDCVQGLLSLSQGAWK